MNEFHHRITGRDIEIFAKLVECRVMSTHQIHAVSFGGPSPSRCIMRLKFLYDTGFVGRIEQPSLLSEGRKPYIYVPKLPAIQLLALKLGLDVEQIVWDSKELSAGYPFLAHILDIAEVNIRFTLSVKRYSNPIHWLNELTLKRKGMIDRFEMVSPSGVKQNASIVPDATFVITADRPYRFLLEVDKGTEPLKDIEMKMMKYRHYFQGAPSLYEQRYGVSGGRVVFVAASPLRLNNLKAVCEKAGGLNRYWFALLSDIQTQDPLKSPIWRKAGRDELVSLF
jgi:Replication-relaxation